MLKWIAFCNDPSVVVLSKQDMALDIKSWDLTLDFLDPSCYVECTENRKDCRKGLLIMKNQRVFVLYTVSDDKSNYAAFYLVESDVNDFSEEIFNPGDKYLVVFDVSRFVEELQDMGYEVHQLTPFYAATFNINDIFSEEGDNENDEK